jgi:hypothetical protein
MREFPPCLFAGRHSPAFRGLPITGWSGGPQRGETKKRNNYLQAKSPLPEPGRQSIA